MNEDKLELELSATGGKVAVGGKGISRITDSLADLLSPFSQSLGMVGDHVRIFRERSVQQALETAKKISSERGEAIRPVNPKNLLPWLENASLEDEKSDLAELWARLLLSGDEDFDADLAMFTDSLKRMGRNEANVLRRLCVESPHFPSVPYYDLQGYHNSELIRIALRDFPATPSQEKFDAAVEGIFGRFPLQYAEVADVDGGIEKSSHMWMSELSSELSRAVDCLERERLVQRKVVYVESESDTMSVGYVEATSLGVRFMARCYPELVKKPNESPPADSAGVVPPQNEGRNSRTKKKP